MINHTKSYHKGHPNPQFYRDNYQSLNGEWDFVFDENNEGLVCCYFKEFPKNYLKIIVPYAYQSEKSGINLPDKDVDVMWYRKFTEISNLDKKHILKFIAVDYECWLFVNGQYVGTHKGGYDHFSFDISPFVAAGQNEIVLRVEDKKHIDQFRGKQICRNENYTCFYTPTGGITGDVYIEEVEDLYIGEFSIRGDYSSKEMVLNITVSCPMATLAVKVDDNIVEELAIGQHSIVTIPFTDAKPWSASSPRLYDVELILKYEQRVCDKVQTYCGFVSLENDDGYVSVNGQKTYLVGVLDQGYFPQTLTTPTEEQLLGDILLIKELGFNFIRKHEKIEQPLFYYYMDVLGLYSSQEAPSAMAYSSQVYKQSFVEIISQIKNHISHPCIIEYVLYNESWGIQGIDESREIQQLTVDLYKAVKDIVGDRFVITNDGWEQTLTDIVTFHNYNPDYSRLKPVIDCLLSDLLGGNNAYITDKDYKWATKVYAADDFKYCGQPVMLTEFAGIQYSPDNNGWGYGQSTNSEEEFFERYQSLLQAIKESPRITGFCMTQLTDVQQETNGLLYFDRTPKFDVARLKKLHESFKL